MATKAVTLVDQDKWGEIRTYSWSPDSKWIAWERPEENNLPKVFLFSLKDKKPVAVTDDWYASGDCMFSDDGKYLLFVSSRDFKPTFGQNEWNVYRDMSRVYLMTLAKDTPSPLEPRSDEVGKDEKKEKEAAAASTPGESPSPSASPSPDKKGTPPAKDEKKPDEPKKPVVVKVDLDGIEDRLVALKIPPGDYGDLRMVGDRIFYLRQTLADDRAGDDDSPANRKSHLCSYSLEDRKETVHGQVNSYEITADGKKMLVKVDKDYAIIDLPKDKLELKDEKAGKDFKLKLEASTCSSTATPSGSRSTTNPGGRCATSSTRRTCTASIGRRSATSTRRSCRS